MEHGFWLKALKIHCFLKKKAITTGPRKIGPKKIGHKKFGTHVE